MSHDVIAHVEDRLVAARKDAARAVDRADALVAWRSRLFSMAAELGTPELTADRMWDCCADEEQRARLAAVIDRALPPPNEGTEDD